MKKYIIIFILIVLSFFIKIPEYIELNNLKVIESIKYDCREDIYYLSEIIPIKEDNGIEYDKKIHKLKLNEINNKYFLRDVKKISSTCGNGDKIKKELVK